LPPRRDPHGPSDPPHHLADGHVLGGGRFNPGGPMGELQCRHPAFEGGDCAAPLGQVGEVEADGLRRRRQRCDTALVAPEGEILEVRAVSAARGLRQRGLGVGAAAVLRRSRSSASSVAPSGGPGETSLSGRSSEEPPGSSGERFSGSFSFMSAVKYSVREASLIGQ
jgi:hypothetical protein